MEKTNFWGWCEARPEGSSSLWEAVEIDLRGCGAADVKKWSDLAHFDNKELASGLGVALKNEEVSAMTSRCLSKANDMEDGASYRDGISLRKMAGGWTQTQRCQCDREDFKRNMGPATIIIGRKSNLKVESWFRKVIDGLGKCSISTEVG